MMKRYWATIWVTILMLTGAASASAQNRSADSKIIGIKVNEVVLEAINFQERTARMSLALSISNPIPVRLKDFQFDLRLFRMDAISGDYAGEMKVGGKRPVLVNLPFTVNLRSIPKVVWSAFRNKGRLQFDLDTAFTLPLLVFEKRFEKSLSGEIPLKSLVDAASLLRASRLTF